MFSGIAWRGLHIQCPCGREKDTQDRSHEERGERGKVGVHAGQEGYNVWVDNDASGREGEGFGPKGEKTKTEKDKRQT